LEGGGDGSRAHCRNRGRYPAPRNALASVEQLRQIRSPQAPVRGDMCGAGDARMRARTAQRNLQRPNRRAEGFGPDFPNIRAGDKESA